MLEWRAKVLEPTKKPIRRNWAADAIPKGVVAILAILLLIWGPVEASESMEDIEQQVWDAFREQTLVTAPSYVVQQAHQDPITNLTYSPDGATVATGSQDGTVALWDARDGSLIRTLIGHSDGVNSIAFSPDGQRLISGSDDRTAILWDVSQGTVIRVLDPIVDSRVVKVDFSPDGSLVALGGNRCVIELRRVPSGILSRTIVPVGCAPGNPGGSVDFWGLDFTEDGSQVLVGDGRPCCGGGILQWYTTRDYLPPNVLKTGNVVVRDLVLSPDGSEIALALVGLSDIWILDASDGILKSVLPDHVFRVNDVEFSPDGSLLASVANDTGVALWNRSDGTLLQMVQGHLLQATALGFSPDGQYLATGSQGGELRIWEVQELLDAQ